MEEKFSLIGVDGNAFSVMGYVRRALKHSGLSDRVDEYTENATSGDYNNLLVVSMEYIDLANEKWMEEHQDE